MTNTHTKGLRLRTKLLAVTAIIYLMLVCGSAISLYYEGEVFQFVEKTNTYVNWMINTLTPDDKSVATMYLEYYDMSRSAHQRARLVTVAVLLVSFIITLMMGYYFVRKITGPMNRLVKTMRQVAQGDLTVQMAIETNDEIGETSSALNQLVQALNQSMLMISQASDTVATGAQELNAAAEQLSSAAQEQASSLEETAASMEEMTSTVKQNADNALRADKMATKSREAANEGVVMSASLHHSMEAINAANTKIAAIIGVIDEIAFQTNLLALNAAVEAAHAGEQGRGFAVVASEVRNLAQRSAAAAKEIKALIKDSVDKVQDGVQLVGTSSKTLESILDSVKNTAEISAEISVSSQEQASGIEQVNRAIMQMDGATQTNAAQVEELSGTSQSLTSQAERLREILHHFTLTSTAGLSASVRQVTHPAMPDRSAPGTNTSSSQATTEAPHNQGQTHPAPSMPAQRASMQVIRRGQRDQAAPRHAVNEDWKEF